MFFFFFLPVISSSVLWLTVFSCSSWNASWKVATWYLAYPLIVVMLSCELHLHTCWLAVWSQFSSLPCFKWLLTFTGCSGWVSSKVFVANSPRSSLSAAAMPRTTVMGCCKQNSCSWGEKASFLFSK